MHEQISLLINLVLGSYVYTTLVVAGSTAGFLYLASWIREIMQNHIEHLHKDVEELKMRRR